MSVLTTGARLLRSLSNRPMATFTTPTTKQGFAHRQSRLAVSSQQAGPPRPPAPSPGGGGGGSGGGGGGGGGGPPQTFQQRPRPAFGNYGGSSNRAGYGGRGSRGRQYPPPRPTVPMNEDVRAVEVRVVGELKEPLGTMNTEDALAMAKDLGVDLILVVPDAKPPVCRLMEYSKYNYELLKAAKDAKKKQKESAIETKEVKLRPATDVHDYQTKVRAASKFLAKGARVKLTVQFKGREMEFKEIGREMFSRFYEDLGGEAEVSIEQPTQMQGRQMTMVVAPKFKEA